MNADAGMAIRSRGRDCWQMLQLSVVGVALSKWASPLHVRPLLVMDLAGDIYCRGCSKMWAGLLRAEVWLRSDAGVAVGGAGR